MIASATVNSQGGNSKPSDFLPKFGRESEPAAEFVDPSTVDENLIKRKVIRANAALGGE
jgi:hypothetical protein